MRNLNNLVSLPAGDVLIIAYGINDGGSIAGAGTFNGQLDAFRLDPMPMFAGTPGRQTATARVSRLSPSSMAGSMARLQPWVFPA